MGNLVPINPENIEINLPKQENNRNWWVSRSIKIRIHVRFAHQTCCILWDNGYGILFRFLQFFCGKNKYNALNKFDIKEAKALIVIDWLL